MRAHSGRSGLRSMTCRWGPRHRPGQLQRSQGVQPSQSLHHLYPLGRKHRLQRVPRQSRSLWQQPLRLNLHPLRVSSPLPLKQPSSPLCVLLIPECRLTLMHRTTCSTGGITNCSRCKRTGWVI